MLKLRTSGVGLRGRPHQWRSRLWSSRCFYESLGITPEASREEVLFAYSRILDSLRNEVSYKTAARRDYATACIAYEVLSQEELRKVYDVEGLLALPRKYTNLMELLNYESEMNEDGSVRTVLCISLEIAIFGGSSEVVVKTRRNCTNCSGEVDVKECLACEGSGLVMITRSDRPLGVQGVCPVCGGDGFETRSFCQKCRGKGEIEVHKKIHFTVPAGVDTGTVLRLSGLGGTSIKDTSMDPYSLKAFILALDKTGDVLVGLVVNRNSSFRKFGNDIYSNVQVPYTSAILGGNIVVSTIWGTSLLQIPSGVQHGQQLVLEGEGVKKEGICGDHVFEVKVSLPTSVTSETVILLKRLSGIDNHQQCNRKIDS